MNILQLREWHVEQASECRQEDEAQERDFHEDAVQAIDNLLSTMQGVNHD